MSVLGSRGIAHIMLEGGATLIGAALRARIVDRAMLFYAPKILGGSDALGMANGRGPAEIGGCVQLDGMTVRSVGCRFSAGIETMLPLAACDGVKDVYRPY